MNKEDFDYAFASLWLNSKFKQEVKNLIRRDEKGNVIPHKKYKPCKMGGV